MYKHMCHYIYICICIHMCIYIYVMVVGLALPNPVKTWLIEPESSDSGFIDTAGLVAPEMLGYIN